MKPEAQRIAIAEACGYEVKKIGKGKSMMAEFWGPQTRYIAKCVYSAMDWGVEQYLPDYLHDLNAMYEAEKALGQTRTQPYLINLNMIVGSSGCCEIGWTRIHSTAAQRAEAFLRTIGKWAED